MLINRKYIFNDFSACIALGVQKILEKRINAKIVTSWDYNEDTFTVKILAPYIPMFVVMYNNFYSEVTKGLSSKTISSDVKAKYNDYLNNLFYLKQDKMKIHSKI